MCDLFCAASRFLTFITKTSARREFNVHPLHFIPRKIQLYFLIFTFHDVLANGSNDTKKAAGLLEKTELMNAMKRELDEAREVESAQRVEIETLKREHSQSIQKSRDFEVHIAKFKVRK